MQKQGDCFVSPVLGTASIKAVDPWQSIQARFVWVRLAFFENRKECVVHYALEQYCNVLGKRIPMFHLVVLCWWTQNCTLRFIFKSHTVGFKNVACDKTLLRQKHKELARQCASSIRNNIAVLLPPLWLYQNPFLFFFFLSEISLGW